MDTPASAPAESVLRGVRVLVTRAPKDAAPLRERLERLGAEVVELPSIAIAPPEDDGPLAAVLADFDSYDWIVFTSRNAVEAVFGCLHGIRLGSPRIAAVGPSTQAALEDRGLRVSCIPAEATASSLLTALVDQGISDKRVLLPTGDLARPELRDGLRGAGAQVDEVIAYRTIQPLEIRREALDDLRRGRIDVIALTSPSALHNLAAMLGASVPCLQYVRLACIGPTTAAAVRELHLEPATVAAEHTIDGLTAAIASLYAKEKT
jgi:uroporphyrinogen-III synthase